MPFDCPRWPPDWPEIDSAVASCLRSGAWGRYHSELCQQLQARLADRFDAPHCRLCCSGTAALEMALRTIGVAAGDEVLLAAFDYAGNFRTIELLGARPVLLDTAAGSPCLDANSVADAASDTVVAVVASHLFGRAANIAELRRVCDDRGWFLVEDACQVHGMVIAGRPAGSFGHLATLSFGGSKLISAGSGGALLVHSDRLAARLAALSDRPSDVYPLSPLQAAVIGPQLDRLDELNQVRLATVRHIESEMITQLSRWEWISGPEPSVDPAYYKLAWLAASASERRRIIAASQELGLPIGEGFRSMSRSSERRCRKPMPTPRADELSEKLFVLDHSALLLDPERYGSLRNCLQKIHDGQ